MAKKALRLFFPQNLIREPVMFLVARDHNLILSICRAKITQKAGDATIVLEGSEADLARAEKVFKEKGVKVENVLGDLVE